VNTFTPEVQSLPMVARGAGGEFVVVWASEQTYFGDVFGQRFDSAGAVRVRPAFQLERRPQGRRTAGEHLHYRPGFEPRGRDGRQRHFLVAWDGYSPAGSRLVLGRHWTSSGIAIGAEFVISDHPTTGEEDPSLAMGPTGEFVVAWASPQDGAGRGIFARRFAGVTVSAHPLDVDGNGGAPGPLTDGLLILRYLFGFRGATLVTGAVGGGCTRCTATPIESYLAALI
jgi:hypothetical protein